MKNKNKKVLVAISGGVDSAVSAYLLCQAGYSVSGIFLNFWKDASEPSSENKCCSLQAQMDAKNVCLNLQIPFYTFNFSQVFKKEVVDDFLSEYSCGRTPNPCVVCNKKVKIGGLLQYAKSLGFDYLATGHYVQVKKVGASYKMFKGLDKNKDQSYFLYTLDQKQLAKLIFPLGQFKKPEVRKIAQKIKLKIADKHDSQEICFIPGKRHNDFLKKYLKMKSGEIRLLEPDKIIGEHQGLPLYTIGQRRGIEIGGDGPYYVAKFDYQKNILYVVKNFADPILYKSEMEVKNINWLQLKDPKFPLKAEIIIRYQHKSVKGLINYNKKNNTAQVKFYRRQRAITPGQSAVFYNNNELLGGGIII